MSYPLQLACLLFYVIMYFKFREGLFYAFSISKKKRRKGFQNFWWFESHHQIGAIGKIYYVNKFYLIAWCLVAVITVGTGYLSFMKPVLIVLNAIVGLPLIPMYIFGFVHTNRAEYGEAFVVLKKRKTVIFSRTPFGGYYSTFEDVLLCCIPVLVLVTNIIFY